MKKAFGSPTLILTLFATLLGGCGGGDNVYVGSVTTIAGTGTASSVDGTGTLAGFDSPLSVTTDGTNLYVADSANHTIRKIVIATGVVTTLAGQAGSPGATDGTGTAARFNFPSGITTDGIDLYVADTGNSTIRQVEITTGNVSTFAGMALNPGSTDGTGTAARFNAPMGIVISVANLYVADSGNHTIRQITLPLAEVTTLAGQGVSGLTDSPASAVARFNNPSGITSDGINLYVADTSNHAVRSVGIVAGDVTTIAGAYPVPTPGVANGIGTAARFNSPIGIVRDGANVYVADSANHTIRQIEIVTGVVTTLAGAYPTPASGVADGTGVDARFNNPSGITSDGTSLYVTDTDNHTIRKIQ